MLMTMIDVIKTLKNLNKKFPRFQLNTLFDILYCIEEKDSSSPYWLYTSPRYTPSTITCADTSASTHDCTDLNACNNTISACDNQMILEPKKHHMKDKTSKNVRILTKEVPADVDDGMDDMQTLYKETLGLFQDYLNKLDNEILK